MRCVNSNRVISQRIRSKGHHVLTAGEMLQRCMRAGRAETLPMRIRLLAVQVFGLGGFNGIAICPCLKPS